MIVSSTSLVKSGNRRIYDRSREGLNGNGGKAAGGAIMLGDAGRLL